MGVESVKATFGNNTFVLPYNSENNVYDGDLIAPSISSYNQPNKYYGISIVATDSNGNSTIVDSGNEQFGDQLKIVVNDVTPPIITPVYPTDSAVIRNKSFMARWTVFDEDSGTKQESITASINGEQFSCNKTLNDGKYECSCEVTVSDYGKYTIEYSAEDNSGNKDTVTVNFAVDVEPQLSITTPSNNQKVNKSALLVTGYTNDYTMPPVTLLVNGEQAEVHRDGYFEITIPISDGENTITVSAEDNIALKTEITRTVLCDTVPPTISSVSCEPNPVKINQNITITTEVTDG